MGKGTKKSWSIAAGALALLAAAGAAVVKIVLDGGKRQDI